MRKESAGIDLGIHNPVCISDDEKNYVLRMSDRQLMRIHYLERRIKRLQSIMDKKTYGSKNYYKVLKKFRITHKKIVNIRLDWRRKLSRMIAMMYKQVCVDTYEIPGVAEYNKLPRVAARRINSFNRMYGMYLFNEALKHACWKYHTKYVDSPDNTTRTCSKCGHINPHLPLSQRIFRCEECGFTIDRDINASQNCYDYLLS